MQTEIWHKVKRVIWHTNKKGKVVPSLQFTKAYEIEGQKYDGVAVATETVVDLGIGKGSHIRVKHDEGYALDIQEVKFPKEIPKIMFCKTCHHEIKEYECGNILCPAKGTTPIVKLMTWAFPMDTETAHNVLKPYLADFPVDGITNAPVYDLIDFLHYLNPSRSPRTGLREQLLSKFESGKILHDFEIQMHEWFLVKDGELQMPKQAFWETLTLQGISASDYDILSDLPPVWYGSNLAETLLNKGMSKKGVNLVLSASDAIAQVLKFARVE